MCFLNTKNNYILQYHSDSTPKASVILLILTQALKNHAFFAHSVDRLVGVFIYIISFCLFKDIKIIENVCIHIVYSISHILYICILYIDVISIHLEREVYIYIYMLIQYIYSIYSIVDAMFG